MPPQCPEMGGTVQYPDMVEIVETISRELGKREEGLILDADSRGMGLQPAESLPDPAVDRYLPLEEKLTRAIHHFRSMHLDGSENCGGHRPPDSVNHHPPGYRRPPEGQKGYYEEHLRCKHWPAM
jgi:hypothetical protein